MNLAVNNLLQRDDEGEDPTDDEDPYMHGDDLISLLDINSHHGENVLLEADGALFDEDTFRISRRLGSASAGSARAAAASASSLMPSMPSEPSATEARDSRKSSYRIREQRWYDSYRDEIFSHQGARAASLSAAAAAAAASQEAQTDSTKTEETKRSATSTKPAASFSFGENLQYWIERNGETPTFTRIAGMHSELVAVTSDGQLYEWKWTQDTPFTATVALGDALPPLTVHHPKSLFLQLLNERVVGISTSPLRASVWTESGKVNDCHLIKIILEQILNLSRLLDRLLARRVGRRSFNRQVSNASDALPRLGRLALVSLANNGDS